MQKTNIQNKKALLIGARLLTVARQFTESARNLNLSPTLIESQSNVVSEDVLNLFDEVILADENNPNDINTKFSRLKNQVSVATARVERRLPFFNDILPHLQNITHLPSKETLLFSLNKSAFRTSLKKRTSLIAPNFIEIDKIPLSENKMESIKNFNYPSIIKPQGLQSSIFVKKVDSSQDALDYIPILIKEVKNWIDTHNKEAVSKLIMEEYIEGRQFTFDVYVNSKSEVVFCPIVEQFPASAVGRKGYGTFMTKTYHDLSDTDILKLHDLTREMVKKLNITSTTLMIDTVLNKEKGWIILEIGARIGGSRTKEYKNVFGFNHSDNDLLNKMEKKVLVKSQPNSYMANFNIQPTKTGKFKGISNLNELPSLFSYKDHTLKAKIGDEISSAEDGGSNVLKISLQNKNKKKLEIDIKWVMEKIFVEVD